MSKLAQVTTAAMQPLREMHQTVPRGRLIGKYIKTGFGALVFVGALFTPKLLGLPTWFAMVLCGFGGFMMSQDLLTKYLKVLPAAIGALKGAKPEGE